MRPARQQGGAVCRDAKPALLWQLPAPPASSVPGLGGAPGHLPADRLPTNSSCSHLSFRDPSDENCASSSALSKVLLNRSLWSSSLTLMCPCKSLAAPAGSTAACRRDSLQQGDQQWVGITHCVAGTVMHSLWGFQSLFQPDCGDSCCVCVSMGWHSSGLPLCRPGMDVTRCPLAELRSCPTIMARTSDPVVPGSFRALT